MSLATDGCAHLSRLLEMLGSDHAGERDVAGRKAHALVRSHGLTWKQVLLPKPVSKIDQMVEFALRYPEYCSQHEWDFVTNIAGKTALSEKQRIWLEQIFHRARIRSKVRAA
jgi:hypothetical protein